MKKSIRVRFSQEAEEIYHYLRENSNAKQERMILKAIDNKLELIKSNAHYGESIAKNLIPREYKVKYDVTLLL